MGAEVACRAVVDGKQHAGKALLETKEIIFRGEGFRVVVPFGDVTALTASGGVLHVAWGGRHTARFELGEAAPRWLKKIQNPPSLLDKLGVKAGLKVGLIGTHDPGFLAELATRVGNVGPARAGSDLIFVRVDDRKELDRLARGAKLLDPAGSLWVIRPKGRKEITEAETMAAGKAAGLVDVKVAAFSETHTAEKYVIPLANRGSARSTR